MFLLRPLSTCSPRKENGTERWAGGASSGGGASPQPIAEQKHPPCPTPRLPARALHNAWPAVKFAYFLALMKTMS